MVCDWRRGDPQLVWLLKAKKGSNPEIIGIEVILVSKEAEFFALGLQYIQNPPESALGKKFYNRFSIVTI